jgi:hypothetical protein
LDALERQNRRYKRAGATIVLMALSATLLMGQARATKVLEANEFVLKDASGKVRARLGIGVTGLQLPSNAPSNLASLELYDSAATPMVRLMAATDDGSLTLGPSSPGMPAIAMDANSKGAIEEFNGGATGTRRAMVLNADPTGTTLVLNSSGGEKHGISLTDGDSLKSPSVVVFDAAGFEAQLGVANTTVTATGQQRKTSAASLIFLDKNANVIWTAP